MRISLVSKDREMDNKKCKGENSCFVCSLDLVVLGGYMTTSETPGSPTVDHNLDKGFCI